MDYWQKISGSERFVQDILEWGIPEQRTGRFGLVGGNVNSFATEVKNAEFLNSKPLQSVQLLLPDALRGKIPPVPGVDFSPSTESGSFAKSPLLGDFFTAADFLLLSGDVSKNSATAIALSEAIKAASPSLASSDATGDIPLLITRDAVDLLSDSAADFIERDSLFLVASLAQLQKLFRALLYPKMIMLSQPLMPIVETLHKFTLTYDKLTLVTFHAGPAANTPGQIIIAHAGRVATVPIDHTSYSPISLWAGTLACKVALLNLWNPGKPLEASTAAIFWDGR